MKWILVQYGFQRREDIRKGRPAVPDGELSIVFLLLYIFIQRYRNTGNVWSQCVDISWCSLVIVIVVVDLHAGAVSTSLKTLLARIQILERFLQETKNGEWPDLRGSDLLAISATKYVIVVLSESHF